MKIEFSLQIYKKSLNVTFNYIPSTGSRVVPRGQARTDGHDEANSRFSQIANASKNYYKS
jgi:hypothetical protein